jgi:hypothetical protein
MDYQGNTNKEKEATDKKPEKNIEKVVTVEVIQKPKPIGRKFKETFFGGDFKMSMRYVAGDVLLPALRNLIVDMTTKGMERIVFGESSYRRRPSEYRPRVQYNNPIYRAQDPREISRGRVPDQPRYRSSRYEIKDIVIADRGEAELVVERLIDIIDKYEVASLADLYDLLGLATSHVDNKWGWTYLNNVEIRQIRDGYLIDLPALEEI